MPVIKVKNSGGTWQDIASANSHEHTISNITDLPDSIVSDVEELKEKVGANSVAYQIDAAIQGSTYQHPKTHPASMITGLADLALSGSFKDLKDVPENFGSGTGAGLPVITEEDEGKVLGVVGGEWTKMDAPAGGAVSSSTDILPEQDIVLTPDTVDDAESLYMVSAEKGSEFYDCLSKIEAGKEYIVVFDGVEYKCTGFDLLSIGENPPENYQVNLAVGLGNLSIVDESFANSGEPFALELYDFVITNEDGTTTEEAVAMFATKPGIIAESVTYKVRIYQKATSISWSNITNKPFYEKTHTVVIDESTVTDVSFQGLGATWVKVSEETLPEGTVVGGTISMDGMSLEISRDDIIVENENGIGCFLLGQFPFLMVYVPGEITITALGSTDTVDIPETGTYMFGVGEGESYIFESKEIKKLDNKFLDILEGEDSEETEIFPKQTVTWENENVSSFFEIQQYPQLNKKYIVEFDGNEYECVAWLGEGICLGNTSFMGESYPDTGEPFVAASSSMDGKIVMAFILKESVTESHEIRVYKPATKAMVKGEHIPFVNHTPYSEEEVLPINEYGPLEYNVTYNLYEIDVESDFVLKSGVEYTVTWDDEVYVCEGQDCSSLIAGAVAIGNGTQFGYEGNDEPFIIVTVNGYLSICTYNNNSGDYHTVRIRIVTEEKDEAKPGFVFWNALADRPFGEKSVIIFEGEFQDTLVDNDGDEVNDAWSGEMAIEDYSDASLEEGKRYVVTWEGAEYELECYLANGIIPFIGNTALIGLEDNGVPFIIARDVDGLMGGAPGWAAMLISTPTDLTISGLYSCKIVGEKIEKIPDIYQNQTDWDEKDINRAAFLNNKPFGEMVSAGSVLTDTMAVYDSEDFGLFLTDIDTGISYLKDEYFQVGGKYIIEINGHTLVGYGVDGPTITELADLPSGVPVKGGIVTFNDFDDNGNNHTMVVVGYSKMFNFIITAFESEFTNDESYPVKISVLNCIKKIDQKFLPYGIDYTVNDKITSFNAENLSIDSNNSEMVAKLEAAGIYCYDYTIESSDDYWTETKFTIGEKYILQIGEKSYYAEAKCAEGDWELYFGNLAFVQKVAEIGGDTGITLPNTGEDFLIIAQQTSDIPNGGFYIYGYTDYGDSVSVAMYSGAEEVIKIEEKYLPEPSVFDLSVMGLPSIPLDGTTVSVECDTADLMQAASKGMIKTKTIVNDIAFENFSTLTYIPLANAYSHMSMAVFENIPYVLEINVSETGISGRAISLVVPTT